MARPKHPDLQRKFEAALRELFLNPPDKAPSGRSIVAWCKQRAVQFDIKDDEKEDLEKNFSNYINRAVDHGVVRSNGKKRGYSRGIDDSTEVAAGGGGDTGTAASESDRTGQGQKPATFQWEGLMHFAATMVLTEELGREYRATPQIFSLPKRTDIQEWRNVDMIAVRKGPWTVAADELPEDVDSDIVGLLKKADSTPELIVSAIELKSFSGFPTRRDWIHAISETAANSKWANEAILLFSLQNPTDEKIADDVRQLAQDAGLHLWEMRVEVGKELELVRHVSHQPRPSIRLAQLIPMPRLLRKLTEMLRAHERPTEELGDVGKLRETIRQAFVNLAEQSGFSAPDGFNLPTDRRKIAEAVFRENHLRGEKEALGLSYIAAAVLYAQPEVVELRDVGGSLSGVALTEEEARRLKAQFAAVEWCVSRWESISREGAAVSGPTLD